MLEGGIDGKKEEMEMGKGVDMGRGERASGQNMWSYLPSSLLSLQFTFALPVGGGWFQ